MRKVLIGFAIITLCLLNLRSLFSGGYFPMHDDAQVARVVVMGDALKEGQFPVRWVWDLGYGYGYPIFNFYGPLPYYVGGALYAFGIDGIIATKIMMGLGVGIGACAMFALVWWYFGSIAGLVSTAAFLFIPYRAVQLFVRGSIGELWATSFIPLVILGFGMQVSPKTRFLGMVVSIIGLVGVILSHTVLGYVTVFWLGLALAIYWITTFVRKKWSKSLFIAHAVTLIVALDITAFFWLPALFEMSYTNVTSVVAASADFRNHFVCIGQLWSSQWGFGGSAPGCFDDGLSFKIGKIQVVFTIVSLILFFLIKKKDPENIRKHIVFVMLGILLLSIFFMLPISQFIWEKIPKAQFIQYPWRMLSFTTISVAFLSSIFLWKIPVRFRLIIGIGMILLFVIGNIKIFQPQYTYMPALKIFESTGDIRYRASSVSDEYLPPGISKPKEERDVVKARIQSSDQILASTLKETGTYGKYTVETKTASPVTLQMAYFPGWHFYVNGISVDPVIEEGLPKVIVSEGVSIIEIRFSDTTVRTIGNILSAVTLIFFTIFYVKEIIR